jgi:hypothetical protein
VSKIGALLGSLILLLLVSSPVPARERVFRDPLLTRPVVSIKKKKTKPIAVDPPRKLWFFNYFAEFSGPSADFALPLESYSPFFDYYAPMKVYQSMNLGYNVTQDFRIGTEVSGDLPLQNGVLTRLETEYDSDFVFYDPNIYFQIFNMVDNSFSWINAKYSFDIPASEFSRNNHYRTGIYQGYTWNFKLTDQRFYFGLNLDMWFFIFKNNQGFNRFAISSGHNAGWYIAPRWSLDTLTIFDFAMRANGGGTYTFNPNSVDRLKVTLRFQPILNTVQLGAFWQTPLYYRKLNRQSVGLNFNLWF